MKCKYDNCTLVIQLKSKKLGSNHQKVGVIGAGSFGMAIASLLAENNEVLIYARNPATLKAINEERKHKNAKVHPRITGVNNMEIVAKECKLIFPIVPSSNFRSMMKDFAPYLKPYHFLIHGTKGLDIGNLEDINTNTVHRMSQVIKQESAVVRIGCLSGPNIAHEILEGQLTATVIASRFKEVIDVGKEVLRSRRIQVYTSEDIRGAELAGALKNIIAIAAGILSGLGLGRNLWGLLITRGLTEMIHFGKALGADIKPFLGVAGIGDLVTTASSKNSRNYTVGYLIAKGKTLAEINAIMEEVAEGLRTVQVAKQLADTYQLEVPITRMVYQVLYENVTIEEAMEYFVRLDYEHDVDYL